MGETSGRRTRRLLRRGIVAAVAGLVGGLVPVLAGPTPVGAIDGDQISETLEGCRASADAYDPEGPYVCDDADYTTGNLGSGWNEFDLVPHRLTLERRANSATDEYSLNIVADNLEAGVPGYDFISAPVVNDALSDDSCVVTSSVMQTKTPGIGGTDTSIYRTITVTQDPDTVCVLDYYQRLAIGSSAYPGASLHANLTQQNFTVGGVGARDVSIPVKDILPQTIDKDMSATQGASHSWNVTKQTSPATLNFADTCSATTGARSAQVQITVAWTKLAAAPEGQVTVTTNVYANNVAQRAIDVSVTDVIRSGTTVLDTVTFDTATIEANSRELVGTHTITIPAASAVNLNDIATATYSDPIVGHPPITLQRTATATAVVQQTGTANNATATIADVESITGTGLSFSVDSFTGATGTFGGGYVAGTSTTGPVSWTSASQDGSGSVTFTKTVSVDQARQTTGTLSDTATLTGSQGFNASASASVSITASATPVLTITKTIPNVLQGAETATFVIDVFPDGNTTTPSATRTFVFTAGETSETQTVSLASGIYDVVEQPATGWAPQDPAENVDLTLPTCARTVTFNNTFGPASADVVKITDPVGNQEGWQMCLSGPGIPAVTPECVETGPGGTAFFTTPLVEGTYTVTETESPTDDFDQTSAVGCSFTVAYPADNNRTFTCTFTNTERATVTVEKTSDGVAPPADAFTFELRKDASVDEPGTILDTDTNDASGDVDFDGAGSLVPGEYQVCETGMLPGWHSTLSDDPSAFIPDSAGDQDPDNSIVCIVVDLDPGEDLVLTVANTSPPGGDARTIGFWRNHTSCDGHGNQDPVLDDTLDDAGGSIQIGDLTVDNCEDAVDIVSKRDLSGTNRANDAAYGLAAQLLAAELNLVAGAESCAALTNAVDDAQALLDDIGFDGTGTYLGPKVKGAQKTLRNEATALAATLDAYNNNELC